MATRNTQSTLDWSQTRKRTQATTQLENARQRAKEDKIQVYKLTHTVYRTTYLDKKQNKIKTHIIQIHEHGPICDCIYSAHSPSQPCKHIAAVILYMENQQQNPIQQWTTNNEVA